MGEINPWNYCFFWVGKQQRGREQTNREQGWWRKEQINIFKGYKEQKKSRTKYFMMDEQCWNSFNIPIRYWVVAKAKHQQNISPLELNFNKILSYFFYNMIEWNTSSRRQRTCSMGFVKHSGRGPPSRQIQFSISILVTSSKPRGTVACMEKYLQWFTNAS